MEIAKVQVSGTRCTVLHAEEIPRGLVGATVSIEYTDSAWDGLQKTVVFRGCVTKYVLNAGSEVVIPTEVVSRAGTQLYMGVYGVDAAGNVIIPTVWTALGLIRSSAAPSSGESVAAQADWAQNNPAAADYIKNKPCVVGEDGALVWTIPPISDSDILAALAEIDMLPVVTDGGKILTANQKILLW